MTIFMNNIKFTIRRENELILDNMPGAFLGVSEVELENRTSIKDFSQIIMPHDTLLWDDGSGRTSHANITSVKPVMEKKSPSLGKGARLVIELFGDEATGSAERTF